MKNPGRAGLTGDRFGDSEKWVSKRDRSESEAKAQVTAHAQKASDPSTNV